MTVSLAKDVSGLNTKDYTPEAWTLLTLYRQACDFKNFIPKMEKILEKQVSDDCNSAVEMDFLFSQKKNSTYQQMSQKSTMHSSMYLERIRSIFCLGTD